MILFAITLLLTPAVAGDSMRVAWDVRTGSMRSRGVVTAAGHGDLERVALEYLSDRHISFGHIVAYRSLQDRFRLEGQGAADCDYENWMYKHRELKAEFGRACPEIWEAIRIGPAIIVQSLDTRCRSQRKTLRGDGSALTFHLSGKTYELVSFRIQSSGDQPSQRTHTPAKFFLKMEGKITLAAAREVTAHLTRVTGAADLSVAVRNDRVFGRHCMFPLVLPFGSLRDAPIPSGEFVSRPEAHCFKPNGQRISCSGLSKAVVE